MVTQPPLAALSMDVVFPTATAEEMQTISDAVMDFLLATDEAIDPSVMIDLGDHSMEVEFLLKGVSTLEEARAVGDPIFHAAMTAAGAEAVAMEDLPQSRMELVPA